MMASVTQVASDGIQDGLHFHKIPIEDVAFTVNEEPGNWLGSGGFGNVYKGVYKAYGNKPVAIKIIYAEEMPPGGLNPGESSKLYNEAVSMFKAKNSHVVEFYGIIMDTGEKIYALVMEFMKYGSLDEVMNRQGVNLPWPTRLKMTYDVCDGLLWLHSKIGKANRIIHQDIKIKNILVDEHLRAKIGDFGLAHIKQITKSATKRSAKVIEAKKSSVAGTFSHMAPERLTDPRNEPNEKSDIYSFGITLFEIASDGKNPWGNCTTGEIQYGITTATYESTVEGPCLSKLIPDCPAPFIEIMKKCTQIKPENRPTFSVLTEKMKHLFDQFESFYFTSLSSLYKQLQEHNISPSPEPMDVHVHVHEGGDFLDAGGFQAISPQEARSSSTRSSRQPIPEMQDQLGQKVSVGSRQPVQEEQQQVSKLASDFNNILKIKKSISSDDVPPQTQSTILELQHQLGLLQGRVSSHSTTLHQHETQISLQSQISQLALTMQQIQGQLSTISSRSQSKTRQNNPAQQKLLDNQIALINDMEPNYYMARLIQDGIVSSDDSDEIKVCPTRKQRAEKLISIVFNKDPRFLNSLRRAMEEAGQGHLSDLLA